MAAKNIVNFVFTADTKQMQGAMGKVTSTGFTMTKALKIGIAGATAAIGGGIVAFAKFEKGLANIDTLLGGTNENIKDIGTGILKIGKEMPVSINDLTTAMYDVRSAGIAANQQFKVLRQSAILATAGLSTTGEAVDIMTSALNTFKTEGLTAEKVADILFKTVKNGKNTVAELAQSFGSVATLVQSAGVSFADFSAATAALTVGGQKASIAQTQLSAAIGSLKKPTAEMQKIFRRLGVKDGVELIKTSRNLGHAFQRVKKESEDMGLSIEKASGRKEAAIAITALASTQNELYTNTLDDMINGEEALTDAFSKQNRTISAQTQILKNNTNVAFIKLGEALLPLVNTILPMLTDMFSRVGDIIAENGDVISSVVKSIGQSLNIALNIISGAFSVLRFFIKLLIETGHVINRFLNSIGLAGDVVKVFLAAFAVGKIVAVVKNIRLLTSGFGLLSKAFHALKVAMLANPITALIVGLVALGVLVDDIITNFNEWALTWKQLVNSAGIAVNWLRKQFANEEGVKAINKENDALRGMNKELEKQKTLLKQRKDELVGKGVSASDADLIAGAEMDSGKLDAAQAEADAIKGIEEETDAERKAREQKEREEKVAKKTEWWEEDVAILAEQRDLGLISQEEFVAKKTAIEQKYANDKVKLGDTSAKTIRKVNSFYQVQEVKDFQANAASLVQLQNSKTKEVARVGATANMAMIAMDIPRAAMGAYAALAGIPFVGPALGIAAAAAAIAFGAEQMAAVGKASFAVGTDFVDSDQVANIHKGEAIIPARENQFLQSGKLSLVGAGGGTGGGGGDTYITEVYLDGAVFQGEFSTEDIEMIADGLSRGISERRISSLPERA